MKIKNILGWFLPLRLGQYILLLFLCFFWLDLPEYVYLPFTVYSVVTLLFSLALAFDRKQKFINSTYFLITIQFLLELYLEASIIYATGSLNSPYTILLLLSIVSGALIYRLIGTLVMASVVSFAFTITVWMGHDQENNPFISMRNLKEVYNTNDNIFYPSFFYILIFYFIAFISGYLAERLRERDHQLADTSLALKKAKLETDDILKHLNSGLLTIDAAGKIIYFNRAAERILGYREEDVKGLACEDVFSERMPKLSQSLLDGLHPQLEHPRMEIKINSKSGAELPIGLSTSILVETDMTIRGVIAIFTDISEAKLMESKIRSADRLAAVGELSASIAHEIRNPLAAISGSVELLKADIEVAGDNEKLMNLIIKESDRLTNLLNEFLTYAKIDRTAYNKIELFRLISEVIEISNHHPSHSEGISFKIDTSEPMTYIVGDEGMLKQLLLNLVVNACEAMAGKKGEISFRISRQSNSGKIYLYISDEGCGISPEQLNNIFTPFYSTKKSGTGLGLAIVDRICNSMKTPISIKSDSGVGTIFKLELTLFQLSETNQAVSV